MKPGLIASGIVSAWTWAATLVSIHVMHTSTSLTHGLDSFNPVQLRTNLESPDLGMYLVKYYNALITNRWFTGGMVVVQPCKSFYSHNSQPSSSSKHLMHTHGLRLSVRVGVHWHIVSLCSLGSSMFLFDARQNDLLRIPDSRRISSCRLCSFSAVPPQSPI